MPFNTISAAGKRANFRALLANGRCNEFPGAHIPAAAQLAEQTGFEGLYISGSAIAGVMGYPDIGMTTLTEVADAGHKIARVTNLPCVIDIDTGFGEPMNVARTIFELEEKGLAGCHIEDQEFPKRCGHLDGKAVVPVEDMLKKVRAAADAKRDANFVLIARSDAKGVEGLEAMIERAKAYIDAGADMLFPEALHTPEEFEAVRRALPDVPLLANITEFGKTPLLTTQELTDLGYNMAIRPVSSFRAAMGNVLKLYEEIKASGSQAGLVPEMATRGRLQQAVDYDGYAAFDAGIASHGYRDTEELKKGGFSPV